MTSVEEVRVFGDKLSKSALWGWGGELLAVEWKDLVC